MMKRFLSCLEVPLLIAVPLTLGLFAWLQIDQSALATALVALASIAVFFANYEVSKPGLRQIMPTVVLGALAAAGRIIFAPLPDFKPVSAICILGGIVFGRRSGFMIGALAALVSNFFFGQGAWTPWQMYAWGMIGYLSGVFADHGLFERRGVVLVYGFISALFYGLILNSWYVVGFIHPITWPSIILTFGAGIPLDCIHGAATVLFLLLIYVPWTRKLERIKMKYGIRVSGGARQEPSA